GVAAGPARDIGMDALAERLVHDRPKGLDAAGRALGLHHQQRAAAIIVLRHQQEAGAAGERIQLVGEAVALEGRIARREPAFMRRDGHLFHGAQRRALAAALGAGLSFGLAGCQAKCGAGKYQCASYPHAARPSTLSKSARPSSPPWAASI